MSRDFKFEKRAIMAGVGLLLAADVALGVYSWSIKNSPRTSAQQLTADANRLKLLKADIEYAEKTAANFPKTVKDCDKFEQDLPQAASASSTISAELSEVAKKAGIQLTGVTFHDREVGGRNITERSVEATISGGYTNAVNFLNGLQKSPNYYVVDSLDLSTESSTPGVLRLSLHMRTFFRTAGA